MADRTLFAVEAKDDLVTNQGKDVAADGSIPLTLIINVVVFVLGILYYQIHRPRNPRFCFPRIYLKDKMVTFCSWANFSWPLRTIVTNSDTVAQRAGMQGLLYLRFQLFMLLFSLVVTVIACPILIPINIIGGLNPGSGFFETTASNVPVQSTLFAAHTTLFILFTFMAMALMAWYQQIYFSTRRRFRSRDFVNSHTVEVRGVSRTVNQAELYQFMSLLYPEKVASTHIGWDAEKLLNLKISKRQAIDHISHDEALLFKKGDRPKHRAGRCAFCATCLGVRKKVDSIEHHKLKLIYTSSKIGRLQKGQFDGTGMAFVTFNDAKDAHDCVRRFYTILDRSKVINEADDSALTSKLRVRWWNVQQALNPDDYYWENFKIGYIQQTWRKTVIGAGLILFALFYSIPIAFLASLESMKNVPGLGIVIRNTVLLHPIIRDLFQGFVPTLLNSIVIAILPDVLDFICKFEGPHNKAEHHASVMRNYYIFIILNVFIFPCLFIGTIDSLVQIFENDPFVSLSRINFALQGAFFINWLIQQTFISGIMKLYRIFPYLTHKWARWNAVSDREIEFARRIVGNMIYRARFSHLLLAVTILLVFSIIVPLVAPAAVIFFFVVHIIDKNNILHVYAKEPHNEEIVPTMLNQFLASLLIYEIAILAFFFIKKSLFGFIVAIILLFLTLVFGCFLALRNEWDRYSFVRYYEPDLIPWAYPDSLLRTAYCHPGFAEEEEDLETRVNRHLEDIGDSTSGRRVDIVDDVFGDEYDAALLDWETRHNQDQELKGAAVSDPNPDYVPPSHSHVASPTADIEMEEIDN